MNRHCTIIDMRTAVFSFFLLILFAVMCPADTLLDPFHQDQSTCSFSGSPLCDVVGDEPGYDIQMASLVITGGTATVSLFFNTTAVVVDPSSGQLALGSFSDSGFSLIVGDLFFYSPDTVYDPSATSGANGPDSLKYAVPLDLAATATPTTTTPARTFTAGALYQVTGSETASTALSNPGGVEYRPDVTVLMTAGNLVSAGNGVTVANYGNGTTSASYEVTVSFQTTNDFLTLVQGGQIGILFSSAECANDVIQGLVTTSVPEPQSLALMVVGLGMLVGVGAWRRRTTRKSRAA